MENLGDQVVVSSDSGVPTQTNGKDTIPALFHVATMDSKTGTVFLKIVNPTESAQTVNFDLQGAKNIRPEGIEIQLVGTTVKDMNTLDQPKRVAPVTNKITGLGSKFQRSVPAYSVTVLKIETR